MQMGTRCERVRNNVRATEGSVGTYIFHQSLTTPNPMS